MDEEEEMMSLETIQEGLGGLAGLCVRYIHAKSMSLLCEADV